METYIVIRAAHRSPVEVESYRLVTTVVESHSFSSVGDRLATVWYCFDRFAADQQLLLLHDGGIAALICETLEAAAVAATDTVNVTPVAWR